MRGPAARRRTARTMARTNEGALSDEEVRAAEGAASLWDTSNRDYNFVFDVFDIFDVFDYLRFLDPRLLSRLHRHGRKSCSCGPHLQKRCWVRCGGPWRSSPEYLPRPQT